jgi:hypothetical protein
MEPGLIYRLMLPLIYVGEAVFPRLCLRGLKARAEGQT